MKKAVSENEAAGYPLHRELFRVKDLPLRLQPREMLEQLGPAQVSDEVLLAVLLRTGMKKKNVVELARELRCEKFTSLNELSRASREELEAIKGIGRVKAQILVAALELARRLSAEHVGARPSVKAPADVAALLADDARRLEAEVFWMLPLDAKNRLITNKPCEITKGILDASLVHPREIFRPAIRLSSASVILAHNHPSGDPTPSREDLAITRQMVDAGRLLGIRVLDHVVLGRRVGDAPSDFYSIRETALVNFEET